MSEKQNIFYARNRSDLEVRAFRKKHDIEISKHPLGPEMVFIDAENTDMQELAAVEATAREGVTVYLMALSDLGHGAKANQMRKRLEATGASVVVPETIPAKRGPKPKWSDLTEQQINAVRPLYDQNTVTKQYICDKILRDTGVEVTRFQLPRIFATSDT